MVDEWSEDEADGSHLDEALARRFAGLKKVEVPDVWSRVVGRPQGEAGDRVGFPRRALAAAAALFVIGAGAYGLMRATADGDGTLTVTADGTVDGTVDVASTDLADGETAQAESCDLSDEAARIGSVAATFDYEPSSSPAALAAETVVLRGQMVTFGPAVGGDGSVVQVKVRDVVGADSDVFSLGAELFIPGSGEAGGSGTMTGDFVAFVLPGDGGAGPWMVVPEGLWIGCGDEWSAVPVLVRPEAVGWQPTVGPTFSLRGLWEAAVFDGGERISSLAPPVVDGDGMAVFDVGLVSGDRLRVSVPGSLGDVLDTLTEPAGDEPVMLSGPGTTLSIAFDRCPKLERMAENRLGSVAFEDGPIVGFCRPNEQLSSTLETDQETRGMALSVDVRPIVIGSRYRPASVGSTACENCAPWGPLAFPDLGVVVNSSGETWVTAVSIDDLSDVWTMDAGGTTSLHGGGDALFVEVDGGDFLRLDPATGAVEWRVERDEGERAAGLQRLVDGSWVLRSSFQVESDDRAPLLRLIDPDTGSIRWTAEGRPGSEWQWTDPVMVDGLMILMDVTNNPLVETAPIGGSLRAYDWPTGRLVWETDLASPTEAFSTGLLHILEVETGQVLVAQTVDGDLVRVDPTTGTIRWRTPVGQGRVDGTTFGADGRLAISLSGPGSALALDPETGAEVE